MPSQVGQHFDLSEQAQLVLEQFADTHRKFNGGFWRGGYNIPKFELYIYILIFAYFFI